MRPGRHHARWRGRSVHTQLFTPHSHPIHTSPLAGQVGIRQGPTGERLSTVGREVPGSAATPDAGPEATGKYAMLCFDNTMLLYDYTTIIYTILFYYYIRRQVPGGAAAPHAGSEATGKCGVMFRYTMFP